MVRFGCTAVVVLLAGCGEALPVHLSSHRSGAHALRPDDPASGDLFRYEDGADVETLPSPSGAFAVHFTRQGPNRVPGTDGDDNGVPDFAESVAALYDEVLVHYRDGLGFRVPLDDGDGVFDVYLLDFDGMGDGAYRHERCDQQDRCSGYMIQENDYKGYGYSSLQEANRILASHELFHGIQAAYRTGFDPVLPEGSAVWATEHFDPSLRDFEGFIGGYLSRPERSLDAPMSGPVDPFSYGMGLFFQFLSEAYGDGIIVELWEEVATEPADAGTWLGHLNAVLERRGESFGAAMVEFSRWNLFTGVFADPERAYARGASYPRVAIDAVELPFVDGSLRMFHASARVFWVDAGAETTFTAAVAEAGLLVMAAPVYGSRYGDFVQGTGSVTVDLGGAPRAVVVLINPAMEGPSVKTAFCLGVPCAPESTPEPPAVVRGDPGGGCGAAAGSPAGLWYLVWLCRRRAAARRAPLRP